MSVFETRSLLKPSLFEKLFNKLNKKNYLIELENLLAANENNILLINEDEIVKVKTKYNIRPKDFKTEKEIVLDKLIARCILDKKLSNNEKSELTFLCKVLDLSTEYLEKRLQEEGRNIYREKVKNVILDNKIEDSEREELEEIKKDFSLDDETGRDIYSEECKQKIQNFVDGIIENRRMSPEEDKQLNEMISGMNVEVSFTDNGLDILKKFWQVENGELEEIDAPINFQKGEKLYYTDKIKWFEERKQTTSVSYGGITTNFRICKGVSIRGGSIAPSRHTEEVMKLIDDGDIYLTNKRIIFMGAHGNKNIPYSKVLAIVPYRNGVTIEKDAGKSPFFESNEAELLALYIARLLKDF